jgi:hypothetical protein
MSTDGTWRSTAANLNLVIDPKASPDEKTQQNNLMQNQADSTQTSLRFISLVEQL